jgi:hypothetical protein
MTVSGISLVDANVWLAIAVDGHVHHVLTPLSRIIVY